MSKTSGNCVWLDDSPQDMFGKIMRLPDEHVVSYMELLTDIPINKIESLPDNPLENKKLLALDITTQFHGKDKASEAQNHFETTVQGGGAPLSFSTITTTDDSTWTRTSSSSVASTATTTTLPFKSGTLFEICKQSRVPGSNAYIKDVIRQGGVEWNGKKITNPNEVLEIKGSDILKFGKKTFRKII
jgi:tyrosyl-tRNA synthetase